MEEEDEEDCQFVFLYILKVETACFSQTLVLIHQTTRRHVLEDVILICESCKYQYER
jgi:hypothetical protein